MNSSAIVPGKMERTFRIYQYTARPPGKSHFPRGPSPDWLHPVTPDLDTRQEAEKAVLQACSDCPIDPSEDADAAKVRMDAAATRMKQNPADAASQKDHLCHKRVLEFLQQRSTGLSKFALVLACIWGSQKQEWATLYSITNPIPCPLRRSRANRPVRQ